MLTGTPAVTTIQWQQGGQAMTSPLALRSKTARSRGHVQNFLNDARLNVAPGLESRSTESKRGYTERLVSSLRPFGLPIIGSRSSWSKSGWLEGKAKLAA